MCNVMESGSKTMKGCQFPFIFKGQTFDTCTDFKVIDRIIYLSSSNIIWFGYFMPISNPMFYFSIKDPDGKLWCSTLLDAEGKHVGGKGHWGYCENFQYSKGCKFGKLNTEVQDFLKEELGILGNGCLSILAINIIS